MKLLGSAPVCLLCAVCFFFFAILHHMALLIYLRTLYSAAGCQHAVLIYCSLRILALRHCCPGRSCPEGSRQPDARGGICES